MYQYMPGASLQLQNLGLETHGLDARLYRKAGFLFLKILRQSKLKHFWHGLRRQKGTLLDLSSVQENCRVTSQYELGTESIALEKIVGSASKSQDFDSEFRPRHSHLRQCWVNVAALRLMNVSLPSVELVRIGEVYFVIDGHHRISVARALGQTHIDAKVIVWHLELTPYPGMVNAALPQQKYFPSGLRLAKDG
jgi:hypothetical protein